MALVLFYTFKVQKHIKVTPRDFLSIDKTMFRDYLFYGVPVGVTDAQWALIGMLKSAIIGHLGGVFMAANSIATSMHNLGTLFTFGLAGGAAVVVGKAVGRGDYDTARQYSKTIQIMFVVVGVIMASTVYLVRVPFTSLYGSSADPEVFFAQRADHRHPGRDYARYYLSCQLFCGDQPRCGRQPFRGPLWT